MVTSVLCIRSIVTWCKQNQEMFSKRKKDVSIHSKFHWPITHVNAEWIAALKCAISDISTCDGCLRQSIRCNSEGYSHFESNAWVNADQSVLCIKVSEIEDKHYSSNNNRSSYRHKSCSSPQDFFPVTKIWGNATSTDCIWSSFTRTTLQASSPRTTLSTFGRWCSKYVHWKVAPDCIRQHLITTRYSTVEDGSFFPHRLL